MWRVLWFQCLQPFRASDMFNRFAKASSIVMLLLALSQVIHPTCEWRLICMNCLYKHVYLLLNADVLDNFEQCTAKTSTIMGSVHLGEAKKGALVFPLVCRDLFIPMAGYTKVGILITCLPCITSKRDKPCFPILDCLFSRWWSKQFHTHINTVSKICEILLKKLKDVGPRRMPSGKFHTMGCTRSNINHGLERQVFESLYQLWKRT